MKLRLRTSFIAVAAFALLFIAAMPAESQQTSGTAAPSANKDATPARPVKRLADGHPDLNGFYASSSGVDSPVGATFGPRPEPNRTAKERRTDPNQPPYKPELLDQVKKYADFESRYDPAFYCKPGGVPRIGPPHGIIQAPGMPIVFVYELTAGNTYRIVPVDGRPHDPDADETYYGDSVGHWDGDTLVVDTTHFNDDTWLGIDGWFHSTALHVIERITREGSDIRYEVTLEDPKVFTKPWTMNTRIAKGTTDLPTESALCLERDEGHITDFGEKTKIQ